MASRCILQIYNPIPRLEKVCQGKGFISGKPPMTEDEDEIHHSSHGSYDI